MSNIQRERQTTRSLSFTTKHAASDSNFLFFHFIYNSSISTHWDAPLICGRATCIIKTIGLRFEKAVSIPHSTRDCAVHRLLLQRNISSNNCGENQRCPNAACRSEICVWSEARLRRLRARSRLACKEIYFCMDSTSICNICLFPPDITDAHTQLRCRARFSCCVPL